jgi:hypothetical protein
VVSGNITVYAWWIPEFDITLSGDAGAGALAQADFTLNKSGSPDTDSLIVNIAGLGYTNPRWYVDGTLKGTGASITINAADYLVGNRTLTLVISRGGVSWSKEITFTVAD